MNSVFRIVWNRVLGRYAVASDMARARSRGLPSQVAGSVLMVTGIAIVGLTSSEEVSANTLNMNGNCNSVPGNDQGPGRNPSPESGNDNYPTDGDGTYSTVAGCDANGANAHGTTLYGSFAEAIGNGRGAMAMGFDAEAGQWGTALGTESRATGMGGTAVGFGSRAQGANSVAIGGSGGEGGTGANGEELTALAAEDATLASGDHAIAIGSNEERGAQAEALDGIAIGGQATVSQAAEQGIALGEQAAVSSAGAGQSHVEIRSQLNHEG